MDFWYQGNMGKHYNLSLSETAVYSALCCLCAKGPRNYNCTQISELLDPISADTVSRACKKLLAKGLISIVDNQIRITVRTNASSTPQNAESAPQIAESTPQNAEFLKESTKENINKENNNFIFIKEDEKKKKVVLEKEFIPPSWDEVNTFALNNHIPVDLAMQWFQRWEVCHWQQDTYIPREWQLSLKGYFENATKNPSLHLSAKTRGGNTSPTHQQRDLEIIERDKILERARREKSYNDFDPAAAKAFFSRRHC